MSAGTYRETRWGRVCVALHAVMLREMPGLSLAVGADEAAAIGAAPIITFAHAGETPALAIEAAGSGVSRTFDRPVTFDVECWGRVPLEAEQMVEELLFALNEVAHGRASKPGTFKPVVGSQTAGNLGAKMIGQFMVRIPVLRSSRRVAPVDSGVAVEVQSTDGSTSDLTTLVP